MKACVHDRALALYCWPGKPIEICKKCGHVAGTYTKADLLARAKLVHPKNPLVAVVLRNWIEENL